MPVIGWWHAQHSLLVRNSSTSYRQHKLRSLRRKDTVGPLLLNLALPYPMMVSFLFPVRALHILLIADCRFR